jgi:hypothetical protein
VIHLVSFDLLGRLLWPPNSSIGGQELWRFVNLDPSGFFGVATIFKFYGSWELS